MVDLDIPQPLASDIYYATRSAIDQHNLIRYDDIKLEKKLGTHNLDHVNLSVFGVSVVDTYNFATQYLSYENTSRLLFFPVAE